MIKNITKYVIVFFLFILTGCEENPTTGSSYSMIEEDSQPIANAFKPSDIAALSLWLDASDGSSIFQDSGCTIIATLNADNIACWKDKSSNSFDATMPIVPQAPMLNTIDNLASVEFNGINSLFDDSHSYTARTVFIIYKADSGLQLGSDLGQIWGQYSVGHIAADGRSLGTWSFDGNTGQSAQYSLSGGALSGATTGSNSPAWSYNQFTLVRTQFTSDVSITRQVLGSLYPSFAIGTHQFGGQVSEIIIFPTTLTLSESEQIEGYLSCKWGLQSSLPGGHTYKTECP